MYKTSNSYTLVVECLCDHSYLSGKCQEVLIDEYIGHYVCQVVTILQLCVLKV